MARVFQFIQIDIDYCSLTYSVAPCQASLTASPPTGTIKCFNSLVTCQDRANFTNAPVTLTFSVPTSVLQEAGIDSIPSIDSIRFDPATISLGQNLGQRASLTVTFNDHPNSDTGPGFDKYLADRPYDPFKQGTFWGKFRARQPFLRGRPLRWITILQASAIDDPIVETRNYIIESFTGPDNDGKFSIVAKDILKLADGDRAQAPIASNGFLVAGITDIATAATLSPTGIGNAEYPASGFVAIGGTEICSFTRSGDALTLTRAQLGTVNSAHSAQDRVQLVLQYSAADAADIISDLLQTYAGVDSSFIPIDAWQLETASYLNRVYTGIIAQPTSVNTLISELIEQAGLSVWWDDRDQHINLMVLRGLLYDPVVLSDDNMLADALEITEQPDLRLSQVHTYFGQINPLTSLTDKANYRSVSKIIDGDAEADYGSPAIKEIFSRWIPALGRTIADRLGTILLGRFRDPPRHFRGSVLRGSLPEIHLGDGFEITSWTLQDATGAPYTAKTQITRLNAGPDVIQFESDEVIFTAPAEDLSVRRIIVDANINNINLRSAHDALFPAPVSGDNVVLTIDGGVNVGSTATDVGSLDIGSWPSGVNIVVSIDGRIQGRGGDGGGKAGTTNAPIATRVGFPGGIALYTRYPINLAMTGELWSGGGGGGCAVGITVVLGGGGGAGNIPGSGGPHEGTGANGTTEAGGAAAAEGANHSGAGGGPGLAGANGVSTSAASNGAAAGPAIDGVSFVTTGSWDGTTFTPGALGGDLRGSQIN